MDVCDERKAEISGEMRNVSTPRLVKAYEVKAPHIETSEVGLRHQIGESGISREFQYRRAFAKKLSVNCVGRFLHALPVEVDRVQIVDWVAQKVIQ